MHYFRMSSIRPDPDGLAGTIRVKKDPRKTGAFGIITDVDGNKWELTGQCNKWVLASPYQDDYWTSTSIRGGFTSPTAGNSTLHTRRCRSYAIEVVGPDDEDNAEDAH